MRFASCLFPFLLRSTIDENLCMSSILVVDVEHVDSMPYRLNLEQKGTDFNYRPGHFISFLIMTLYLHLLHAT